MTSQIDSLVSESEKRSSKISGLKDKLKNKIGTVFASSWMMASPMGGTAPAVLPTSVNTIRIVAPVAKVTAEAIALGTATQLLTACGGDDGIDDVRDTTPPTINISKSEIDVTGGKTIRISGNQLYIGDDLVASRSDNISKNCNVVLSINGTSITSGSTLKEEGTLTIKVSDEAGNMKTSTVRLSVDKPVTGLESLKYLPLQVDKEVNLLEGITFGKGVNLLKVQIQKDGETTEISDPKHYTPDYPGECSIILTVKDKDGKTVEYKVDNLTIKALDYQEAIIDNANMISEKYPWYNNLQQSTKNFIYPHLIASYAACNRSKQDNRVHIIMGETANTNDIENIGESAYPTDHAYEGYYRIRALSPDTPIKGCDDTRANLENYINNHPNDFFLVSCASDAGGGNSIDNLNNNPNTAPLRRIIKKENVISICSDDNRHPDLRKMWNENIKNGSHYGSCSINSQKNNKITVTGYNSWGSNNYFSPRYSVYGGLRSAMPIGFDKDKGNILMPMIPLISSNNEEDPYSTSSYPTAVTSGVIGNAISVIMANHPGITAEDAMTIIVNNYLTQEKFQYKDETTNRELVDGDYRYFIDMQKLLKSELLQSDKIDKLQFNSALISLPSGPGICYTGKGIQFEYEGKRYNATNENQSILNQALKSGNIKWYWNKDMFKKFGGTNSASFDVYVVDKNGKKIPNLNLSINKDVV